jgi:predicted NACHT family NTPase
LGGEFQRAEVQPLRWPDDIGAFVRRWNEAVLNATPRAAQENALDLMRRLGDQDQVRALADNPLLLTVMIIVHFNVGRLPDRRAELYDNATELLLGWDTRWRRKLAAPPPWLDAIKPAGKRLYLEELAYHWQQQGTQEAKREAAVAFLARLFVSGKGEEKERQATERVGIFLDWVIERSYLLRPLGATLAFHRRAFQEYLAARRLAREADPVAKTLAVLSENTDWWYETVLLALDHLSASDPERAAALLRSLLKAPDDPPGSQGHLVLAGRALAQASREHLPWPRPRGSICPGSLSRKRATAYARRSPTPPPPLPCRSA